MEKEIEKVLIKYATQDNLTLEDAIKEIKEICERYKF